MKFNNKGQIKTWLVGLLAGAIIVTGGIFTSYTDNVLGALSSRLNDRQFQSYEEVGNKQTAVRVIAMGGMGAGLATSALQTIANALLTTIDADTSTVATNTTPFVNTTHQNITFTAGDETATGVVANVDGMGVAMVMINRSGLNDPSLGSLRIAFTQDGLDWRTPSCYNVDTREPVFGCSFAFDTVGSDDRFLVDLRGAIGLRTEVTDSGLTSGTLIMTSTAMPGTGLSRTDRRSEVAVFSFRSCGTFGSFALNRTPAIESNVRYRSFSGCFQRPRSEPRYPNFRRCSLDSRPGRLFQGQRHQLTACDPDPDPNDTGDRLWR